MKFNPKTLQSSAMRTGMVALGISGGYAAGQLAPAKVKKFAPYAAVGLGLALPLLVKGEAVQNLSAGLGTYGLIATVNNLTAPGIDDAGNSLPQTGIKAMIANNIPQLAGVPGMGNIPYDEYSMPMLAGGHPVGVVGEEFGTYMEEEQAASPMI